METTVQYNPFDPTAIKDPYPIWDQLRREAPVYRSPMESDSWMVSDDEDAGAVFLVTRHKEVSYILEHPEIFTSGSKTGPEVSPEVLEELAAGLPITTTLYNTDPPDHTRLRTLVQAGLSTQQVAANADMTRRTADALIAAFTSGSSAELLEQYVKPLANTALLDFIGIPREDQDQVTTWNKLWEDVFIPGNPPEDQRQAARQVVAYQQYYQRAIDERRANPRADLLTSLATARTNQGESLSMAEIAWCLMELIGAGVANAADGLANILLVLLQEPDRWQTVIDDRGLIPAAIDEGLRLEGPVQWLPRETAQEVQLDGVRIPKGATVMIMHAAANRDPDAFPDPGRFDLRRKGNGRHVAYGRGIHYCVGAGWSRMAIRVGLEALADRLPGLRLSEGYEPEFYLPVPVLRCVAKLPVTWNR